MARSPFRALFLLTSAATLTVCIGVAGAVETWVGADGEIRVVPGTEDPLILAPVKPHPQAPVKLAPLKQTHATTAPVKPVKPIAIAKAKLPKLPPRPAARVAAKPPKGHGPGVDPRTTGAVTPDPNNPNSQNNQNNTTDPNDPTALDKQRMQPRPVLKPIVLPQRVQPLPAPVTDPGNPIITVNPSVDATQKSTTVDEDIMDPGPDSTVANPLTPGALPTNPVDPNDQTVGTPPLGTTGPAINANGTATGVRTIPGAANNGVANPGTNGANPLQTSTLPRLRPVVPLVGPIQPVSPVPPSGVTSSIAQAPQVATTPNPRSLLDDPLIDPIQAAAYDQVGIRINSFIWRPAIEASVGGTSNIQSAAGGTASSALKLAPELVGQSDWSRHSLGIELRGSFTDFPQYPSLFRPTVSATVNGRIDFAEDTQLALKTSYALDKLPSTSSLSAAGTTGAGLQQTITGSAALTRDIGRFALTMRGEVDRTDFQLDQGGTATTTAAALDNTDFIAALRGTYNLSAGVKPFVEVQTDARRYDALSLNAATPPTGQSHDTNGAAVKGGVTLNLSPLLTGEASTGYGFEVPTDHSLQTVRAVTFDENLVWSPTRQTRITLSTVSAIEPSLTANASGAVSRTVGVKIADDLFRNLTVDLGGSYLARHYTGIFRTENLSEVTSGLTWKLSPTLQTFVRGTFDAFSSSAHTDDYKTATIFAGVRLQK